MTLAQDPTTRSAPDRHEVFGAHEGGKLATGLTAPLADERDLSIAYTPGVADVCRAIADDAETNEQDVIDQLDPVAAIVEDL